MTERSLSDARVGPRMDAPRTPGLPGLVPDGSRDPKHLKSVRSSKRSHERAQVQRTMDARRRRSSVLKIDTVACIVN